MEQIILKDEKFYINDIDLKVDPLDISVYKEGLSYSWKTLRTKSSSKILNGNSIFHLKLNLIFTKSMFLDLHRLVCQTKNSPIVQIENEFVSESVSGKNKSQTFFTVNSLQIVPRTESPYALNVELDLRYFNHKVYSGEFLKYKQYFETKTYLKKSKTFSNSFDVSKEGVLFEYEVENSTQTSNKSKKIRKKEDAFENKIEVYNKTSSVINARDSYSYIRYSNFLQIKALKDNFGLDFGEFDFTNFNKRDCLGLHRDPEANRYIIERVYEDDNYYTSIIQYKKYTKLKYTKEESKAFKKYITDKLKGTNDYKARLEKIAQIKKDFLVDKNIKDNDLNSIKRKIENIQKDETINIYTGRQNVNNVFYTLENLNIPKLNDGNLATLAQYTIGNISCGFTNLISNLPISGQEFPAHQFLGSTEPLYNVNIVGNREQKNARGLSTIAKNVERMRNQLQKNAIDFKMIPDAGYFHIENFFTKLLGSHIATDVDAKSNAHIPKYIMRNLNVNTIEGAPGSQVLQFSFYESSSFKEEDLKPVSKLGDSNSSAKKVESYLNNSSSPGNYKKVAANKNYTAYKWSSKYFTADEFYAPYERRGRGKREDFTQEADKNAYNLCSNILDKVQKAITVKLKIFSSVDLPKTGVRKSSSKHYSCGAVDVSAKGYSPLQLMKAVSIAGITKNIGVIAYYTSKAEMEANTRKMNGIGESNFFVHIDDRTTVKRYNPNGDLVKKRADATKKDYTEILYANKTGTYYGLDIDDKSVKKIDNKYIKEWIGSLNLEIPVAAGVTEETEEVEEVETEELIKALPSFREKANSTINPFSDNLKEYGLEVESEIKKVKDLTAEERALVEKAFSLNELNPELEVRIFTGEDLEGFKSKLKDGNFRYAENIESSATTQVFVPVTANNFTIARDNKEARALIKMYDNLHQLANLMLTEPEAYVGANEVLKEKTRINEELKFKEEVKPGMLINFAENITRAKDYGTAWTTFETFAQGVAGVVGTAGLITLTIATEGLFLAVLAGLGAVASGVGTIVEFSELPEIKQGAINLARGLVNYSNFLKKQKIESKKTSESNSVAVADFYKGLSQSDEVSSAFTNLATSVISENIQLEVFSNSLADIKNKTKLFSMLGSYNDVVSKVENEDLKLKSLQSEEIYIGELRRIFEYYFGFPYESGSAWNEYDFGDLVVLDKNKNQYILNPNKKHNASKPKQYHIVNPSKGEFALTKAELLENQNKKIAYLKLLKETIIEAMLENSDVAKQIGVSKDVSIFEIIGENAYPDITLPTDPGKPDNNLNLHPTFYFQTSLDGFIKRHDYINPNMKKNIENIVGKSYDFEEALRKGVYTGDIKNLPSKELNVDNYETIENTILVDSYDGGKKEIEPNSDASTTVLTSDSTTSNLSHAQVVNQRIEDFKDLRKTFDDVFGDITTSEKNVNDFKSGDFKTKEQVIKDTIDACKGLMLPKKTIKKAFPTYRLYLIEEDSIESNRLSVFDDFYTYSGLKSFTVFSHKDMPASTAVIQMQNISGVLDGTKPEVIRDIDIDQNLTPEEEKEEQRKVESIIIRPGINIQLRAGYDSNPNNLKIIFTGRITEVKNSGSGEMLEVTAQSFGVELISKKLGLHPSDPVREKSFYNTHSLLGSLMLREELTHFGRIKKGKKFQVGEAKQLSIDISAGKHEDWFNFSATNWIDQTLYDYGIYLAAASLIIPAAGRLASLRALKTGSNSAVLDFIKGNKIVELFNATENIGRGVSSTGKLNTAFNFVLSNTKKIFIDLPVGFFRRIAGNNIAKKVEALSKLPKGVGINAVNKVPNFTRAKELLKQLSPKELAKLGVNLDDIASLSKTQVDNIILNKYGFSFALTNNLLFAPQNVSYFTAALNGVGAGTILFGDMFTFGAVFRNVVGFYAASIVLGTLIDAVVGGFKGIYYGGIKPAYEYLAGKYNPPSVKILLSPQDDNIFPPPPEEYLVEKNALSIYLSSGNLTNVAKRAFSFIGTYGTGLAGYLTPEFLPDGEAKKIMKNAYLKGDTRLLTSKKENVYQIEGSTIWEILHEMSLRHPGYLYGIRQYGNGLESRVFFGQSSQRMFSKDFSNREVETLNKIDNALLRLKGNVLSDADFEDILGQIPDKEVKTAKTLEVINYWIEKTKERFVPYRQFHNIDSEHDIISNSLRVDASKVVNQVSVTFKADYARGMSGSASDEIITKIKAIPYIKENMINEKGISYPNCKGLANASRYGMSELIKSAKQMYSGEILIVGSPEIRTDDICIINDDYLNMHGLIEVEAVTHMFSFENGFVTEIIPNAVAYGKDKYLSNMISGSLVFDSHRKLIDKYPTRSEIVTYGTDGRPSFDDAKLEALARETVRDFYTDSNSGIYNAIYGSIPWITDYASNEKANKEAIKDIKKQLKESLEKNELVFLSDVTENINFAGQAKQIFGNTINSVATIGGGAYGAVKLAESLHGVNLTSLARSTSRTALIALATVYTLKKVGGFSIDGLESSFKSGTIGKNLFRDVLMTQVSHGNLIRLLPLVKDGKPLVAGGYEYIQQKDRFKEVFGNYFNPIQDSIEGFREALIGLEEDAQLLGVRKYAGEYGFTSTVSATGEYVTNGAISSEVFRLKFGEEEN